MDSPESIFLAPEQATFVQSMTLLTTLVRSPVWALFGYVRNCLGGAELRTWSRRYGRAKESVTRTCLGVTLGAYSSFLPLTALRNSLSCSCPTSAIVTACTICRPITPFVISRAISGFVLNETSLRTLISLRLAMSPVHSSGQIEPHCRGAASSPSSSPC